MLEEAGTGGCLPLSVSIPANIQAFNVRPEGLTFSSSGLTLNA